MQATTTSAHVCTEITFRVNLDNLTSYTDEYIVQLWHISQANPAPFGDRQACDFAEKVGREIIRRFVSREQPSLWNHQGRHVHRREQNDAYQLTDIDQRLTAVLQAGDAFTTAELLNALGLPGSAHSESLARDSLYRIGAEQKRKTSGLRERAWRLKPACVQPTRLEDPAEPLQAPDTPTSQTPASHPPLSDSPTKDLQDAPPPAQPPGQTAPRQSSPVAPSSNLPVDEASSVDTALAGAA